MLRRARPLRTLCWIRGDFPERKVTGVVDFWRTTGSAPPLAAVMRAQLGDNQRRWDGAIVSSVSLPTFVFHAQTRLESEG
jgi:hypothetical protein